MAAAVASHKHQDSMDSVDSDQVQLTTQTQSHGVYVHSHLSFWIVLCLVLCSVLVHLGSVHSLVVSLPFRLPPPFVARYCVHTAPRSAL